MSYGISTRRDTLILIVGFLIAAGPARTAVAQNPSATAIGALPSTVQERSDLKRHFDQLGTDGTLVVRSLNQGTTVVVNPARARTGYLPSSTFKILNSLIALQTGAARDVDGEFFAWSGVPFTVNGKPFLPAACNADLTLRTAFKNSCIPVYQEIARRVGARRIEGYLKEAGYGPAAPDLKEIDWFWLRGGFKISAEEQVAFLSKLARGGLPFSNAAIDAVKEMMVVEATPGYTIRAKTGYVFTTTPEVGWYVGWVERGADIHVFALNLDITQPEHARARVPLTRALLSELGLL